MLIPPHPTCEELLVTMEMPAHIRDHSRLVCRVAVFLSDGLRRAGVNLDGDLIRAAALLHDITKSRSFDTGENHAATGGQYLSELGYPEVGDIVRQHVVLDAYFEDEAPNEAEVVNYADKRVLHDKVVSLHERMTYILHRYARTPERRQMMIHFWEKAELLEKRIFAFLGYSPDQLRGRMDGLPEK